MENLFQSCNFLPKDIAKPTLSGVYHSHTVSQPLKTNGRVSVRPYLPSCWTIIQTSFALNHQRLVLDLDRPRVWLPSTLPVSRWEWKVQLASLRLLLCNLLSLWVHLLFFIESPPCFRPSCHYHASQLRDGGKEDGKFRN